MKKIIILSGFDMNRKKMLRMKEHHIKRERKIPWKDNFFSMATLYSILTAMVGIFLAVIIPDKELTDSWYWPVGLLALSLVCLILGLEKFSDAIDEDDVDKYLAWYLVYNTGVISMFFGIATYIFLHYHLYNCNGIMYVNRHWNPYPFILAFLASWKWIYDIGYLLFINDIEYEAYKNELLGKEKPEPDQDLLMNSHQLLRKLFHK